MAGKSEFQRLDLLIENTLNQSDVTVDGENYISNFNELTYRRTDELGNIILPSYFDKKKMIDILKENQPKENIQVSTNNCIEKNTMIHMMQLHKLTYIIKEIRKKKLAMVWKK